MSAERYMTILKELPDIVYKIDPDGYFTFINDAIHILGYQPNELIGKHFNKIVHPEDVKSFSRFIVLPKHKGKVTGDESAPKLFDERRARKRKTKDLEIRLIPKKQKRGKKDLKEMIGLVITIGDVSSAGHYDTDVHRKDKKFLGTLGIIRDITERKRAEEALRQNERRFRDVAENALEWIWEVDAKGKYTYVSPVVEKILGYKPEEILKKHFYDLFCPEDRDELRKAAFEVFAAKQSFREFINWNVHKNGKTVWLSTSGIPLLDKEGNLVGYRGADTDITERKRAEEELRKNEEKYKTLTENVNVGVYRNTVGPKGKFIEANPAIVKMFGYENKDEFLSINVADLYQNPENRRIFNEKILRFGFVKDEELQLRRKDGSSFIGSVSAVAVKDKRGKVKYYDGIIDDITERKRVEQKLRQSSQTIRKGLEATVNALATAVEMRDPYTAGHQRRVANLSYSIAKEMGLSEDQIIGIHIAAIIHDIGKIHVPAEILSKPSRLTKSEFSIIKTHPQVGYDILKNIDFPWPVAKIVFQHHERIDGSGYPKGLSKGHICLEAKVLGVADVVEAMSSYRPYRPARSLDVTLEEISKNKGIFYDPQVVDACLTLFKEKGFKIE